jgi:hypothetical protein
MPMQAESLEVLEKAEVAPAQARAFVRAIEIEIAGAKDTLATKSDLLALKHDFDVLRAELRGEMVQLRAELRGEIAALATTLRGEMAEIRAELHRSIGGVVRQMYLAILGQMAVMLGFAYFFATHLR